MLRHDFYCSPACGEINRIPIQAVHHLCRPEKVYDTVPRAALWCALKKLGVPDLIIDIVWSLHEGMKVQVRVNGEMSEKINVENGLRQG